MRKTSFQNRIALQQLKLFILKGQGQYLKPQINSFRSNIVTGNTTSTMSDMDVELNGADQMASTEVNAASAANDKDTSEEDSLVDYNEDDETEAAQKTAYRKALKEMLANNGFAYRNILRSEKVKQHFTSPFSKENAMSPEDILSEIPKEDLHEIGRASCRERVFVGG